jgi:hypothetical protein
METGDRAGAVDSLELQCSCQEYSDDVSDKIHALFLTGKSVFMGRHARCFFKNSLPDMLGKKNYPHEIFMYIQSSILKNVGQYLTTHFILKWILCRPSVVYLMTLSQ